MDFELFKKIILEGTKYGPRSFSLHLFGEPLLYPRIFDAISFIKHANKKHTVLLTTNGTLLNRFVGDLIQAGPDLVLWSWRSEAKFTRITLAQLRKWGRFRVRFIKEITPPEAYEEWKDWPNKEERRIHNYGGDGDITTFGAKVVADGRRWPCYHLWFAPAVAWNGDILLCCSDPHRKEIMGHFPEQTVAQVWQGERLNKMRDSHMKGEYGGICKTCDVWKEIPDVFFGFQKK